jgi:hypothetical protein
MCFNTILYVFYILYIVGLVKHLSSICKILIVFLYYTILYVLDWYIFIYIYIYICVCVCVCVCVVLRSYFQRRFLAMFALWRYHACRPYHWPIAEHISLLRYWIIHVRTAVGLLVNYTEILAFWYRKEQTYLGELDVLMVCIIKMTTCELE